ncbi:MAG TPA: hypothetical protein VFS10_09565 [Pyrinomonadaceae bacterium]|nr:hypothetical protein [Pyrinomonadaceae bacterium]
MDVSEGPDEEDAEDLEESEGRRAERGDAAEPDAPTSVEENEGMSTILSGDTLDSVQRDAGDG